jgi:hypothetical protein
MGLSAARVLFDELGVVGVRAGKKLTEQRELTLALMHYEKTASRSANSLALALALALASMIITTIPADGGIDNINRPMRNFLNLIPIYNSRLR